MSKVTRARREEVWSGALAVSRLADTQHGLLTSAQLAELGLTKDAILAWSRAGRLRRVHRGVYAAGHRPSNPATSLLAAALATGSDAVVSHYSAARLLGLLGDDGRRRAVVHVTVARRLPSRPGIRVHVTCHLPPHDVTRRWGIPVTSPLRTIIDLAPLATEQILRRVVREAEVQRLVEHQAMIARVTGLRGRRGVRALRQLLDLGPAPTRSELEDRTLALILGAGLPRPEVNVPIRVDQTRYEVDFLFPDQRLIVEADGAAFHQTPQARTADADRQAALEGAGYRVLRVTWAQVTRDADQTAQRISRALGAPPPTPSAPRPRRRRAAPRRSRPAASAPS